MVNLSTMAIVKTVKSTAKDAENPRIPVLVLRVLIPAPWAFTRQMTTENGPHLGP